MQTWKDAVEQLYNSYWIQQAAGKQMTNIFDKLTFDKMTSLSPDFLRNVAASSAGNDPILFASAWKQYTAISSLLFTTALFAQVAR